MEDQNIEKEWAQCKVRFIMIVQLKLINNYNYYSIIGKPVLQKQSLCSRILHTVSITHQNIKELVPNISMKRNVSKTQNIMSVLIQCIMVVVVIIYYIQGKSCLIQSVMRFRAQVERMSLIEAAMCMTVFTKRVHVYMEDPSK